MDRSRALGLPKGSLLPWPYGTPRPVPPGCHRLNLPGILLARASPGMLASAVLRCSLSVRTHAWEVGMDKAAVQAWLDRYIAAWRSYDPDTIGDLFSDDVEYRYDPHVEPERGREAVVATWTEVQDAPGSWEARYEAWAVDGDRAVALGTTEYDGGAHVFVNCFVLEFDAQGRCRRFTDYYLRPRTS